MLLHARWFVKSVSLLAAFALFLNGATVPKAAGQKQDETRLGEAFQNAATEFDIPRELLIAIAYAETHFDHHNGEPSHDGGYGVMHLVDNPQTKTLEAAAKLINVPVEVLKTNTAENIRGGAALLRSYADEYGLDEKSRRNLDVWYEIVARYSNASDLAVARFYADGVYSLLNSGFSGASPQGEEIIVTAQEVEPRRGNYYVQGFRSPDAQHLSKIRNPHDALTHNRPQRGARHHAYGPRSELELDLLHATGHADFDLGDHR